jgi:hypothetical protein
LDDVLYAKESEEGYGQHESNLSLQLFQHDCASFSDLNSFSNLEIIKSEFCTVEDANVHAHNSY